MSTITNDLVSHLMCGTAIAANDAVYINSADGKIYKYDPLQPLQVYAGIAKEAGLLNAFIRVVQSGRVKGFTGLTAGAFVYASVTVPGGFQLTDPGSSLKVVLGIAKSATELTVNGALGIKTGGGTGSGGINYILNPDADTTVGWATYADAGGVTPVDGTGNINSPTPVAVTLTRSTSSPLRGAASFLYTKPASNVQGQGFSYDFTIDSADTGKVLQGSFDYQIASGTFADDAMSVWIYDITNARMIQPAPYLLKNSGLIERFPIEFQTAINSTSYRLIVHQASTSAVASTIKFDNFNVGPQAKLYGSAVTDWIPYTPTLTLAGNATASGSWKRVGDTMHIKAKITLGSTAPTGYYSLKIPAGYTIDAAKLAGFSASGKVSYHRLSGVVFGGTVSAAGTDLSFIGDAGTGYFWNGSTDPTTPENGAFLILEARVPIQGWSSSQIMSSDADTRVVAARYNSSPNTINTGPTTLLYTVREFDTHGSYNTSTGGYTVPVAGVYKVSASIWSSTLSWTAGQDISVTLTKGGIDTLLDRPIAPTATMIMTASGSTLVNCVAGDVLSISSLTNRGSTALLNDARGNWVTFERVSGPSQIAASESVSALYTGAPPTIAGGTIDSTARIVTFGTRVKDSHNSYSGGLYTAPSSGVYDISSSTGVTGTFTAGSYATMTIAIDGVDTYVSVYLGNVSSPGLFPTINIKSIPLRAGQTVSIKLGTQAITSPVFHTAATVNYFSLTRSGNY